MACQNCEQLESCLKQAVDAQCSTQNLVYELQRDNARLQKEVDALDTAYKDVRKRYVDALQHRDKLLKKLKEHGELLDPVTGNVIL